MVYPTHRHVGDNQTDKKDAFNARLADLDSIMGNVIDIDVDYTNNYVLNNKEFYQNCVFRIYDTAGADGQIQITVPTTPNRPPFVVRNESSQDVIVIVNGQVAVRKVEAGKTAIYFYKNSTVQLLTPHGTLINPVVNGFVRGDFDITSMSYDTKLLDVSGEGTDSQGIRWNGDGTKFYMADGTNLTIYEYDTTGWDVSTGTGNGSDLDVSARVATSLYGFCFADSGNKLFVCGNDGGSGIVVRYDLSSAYDVSTGTFHSEYNSNAQTGIECNDVAINSDGTKMILLRAGTTEALYEYNLSSAYDLTTASNVDSFTLDLEWTGDPRGFAVNADGDQLILVADTDHLLYEGFFKTPFDLTTFGLVSVYDISAQSTTPRGVAIGNSNSKIYILDNGTDDAFQYSVSAPTGLDEWTLDITSTTYASKELDFSGTHTNGYGLFLKPDGTKLYTLSNGATDAIWQWSLGTAWDISTATYDGVNLDISGQSALAGDFFIGNDGATIFVCDDIGGAIDQYTMSTPWDLSTASYASKTGTPEGGGGTVGIWVSPNGHRVLTLDDGPDQIDPHFCKTAWDISTLTQMGTEIDLDISVDDTDPKALFLNPRGSQMIVIGETGDELIAYTLAADYEPLSAGSASVFDISTQSNDAAGLFIRQDTGTSIYVLDSVDNKIYQYNGITI